MSIRSACARVMIEGKRCAETLFFDYWRQHRLRIKVARIFNTYGPRMHPTMGGWYRTSLSRRCLGATSPFMAMARRRVRSAMSTTWSTGSSGS